jgi:hypothetical protein
MNDHAQAMTLSERADAIEEHMMHELEQLVIKSALFNMADGSVADDTANRLGMHKSPRPMRRNAKVMREPLHSAVLPQSGVLPT